MNKPIKDGSGALDKALDILELVASEPSGVSQNNLAVRLDLPRSTVYRLLATLVSRGLVYRDPLRHLFILGGRCLDMARQSYAMPELVSAANLEARSLRDLTGETVYLSALQGMDVVTLDRIDGAHVVRSSTPIGKRKPMFCTSQGKAILAAMEPEQRNAVIKSLTLKPITPLTITDRKQFAEEVRRSALRGYAIDDEENIEGIRCAGAAIMDRQRRILGAISVAGPANRLTRHRIELLGPEIAAVARRIGCSTMHQRTNHQQSANRHTRGK